MTPISRRDALRLRLRLRLRLSLTPRMRLSLRLKLGMRLRLRLKFAVPIRSELLEHRRGSKKSTVRQWFDPDAMLFDTDK